MNEDEIKNLGYRIVDILATEFSAPNRRSPLPKNDHAGIVEKVFCEDLPEEGCSPESLLKVIQNSLLPFAYNSSYPGVFSSVSPSTFPFPALVEALVSGLRLYSFNSSMSPACTQIEMTVVQWLGQFIGYSHTAAGYFATGGTSANLMALLTARVAQVGEAVNHNGIQGEKRLTAYASEYVHECMDQSMRMMGLGTKQLRKIPVDRDFKIRIDRLEEAIVEDLRQGYQPFCVVGIAGVTATGSVDDLHALADIAKQYSLWFHVDGAYGAFAASLSCKKALFTGIDRADSLVCDPHKWLNTPLEAGVIMVKDWQYLKNTFALNVDCMGSMNGRDEHHQWQHGFELSRRDRALKVWLAIKQHGAASYRQMLKDHIQLTEYMAEKIKASPYLELIMDPILSVCCFRYRDAKSDLTEAELDKLNKAIEVSMEEAGGTVIGSAKVLNKTVLRACIVSYRITQHSVDVLLDTVVQTGHQCSRMKESIDNTDSFAKAMIQ